jgi:hypothetical protein
LDTKHVETCNLIPIILGHPFLANSNALMNVFNICKQPEDDNDLQEVDFIEKLVYDQLKLLPMKLNLMNLKICKRFIFRKNQRQIVGD